MVKFQLSNMDQIVFRAAARWCVAPELIPILDNFRPDPENFIRNETEIRGNHPLYCYPGKMRNAGIYSYEKACQLYAIHNRVYPCMITGERSIHVFEDFADPATRCYCKEDYLEQLNNGRSSDPEYAENLYRELFEFQVDLEIREKDGISMVRCKGNMTGLPFSGTATLFQDASIWRTREEVMAELPESWYIHMQIPDKMMDDFCWIIRKPYSSQTVEEDEMALVMAKMIRQSRGRFLDEGGKQFPLEYFWQESGAYQQPARQIKFEVWLMGALLSAGVTNLPQDFKIPNITNLFGGKEL